MEFFPHPCDSYDNWAANYHHEMLRIHFIRCMKEQQIDAFCSPAGDHWGCVWYATAAGVMVPVCCQHGFLWGLPLSQLSTAMALWPSRQASASEISQTLYHAQGCPLSARRAGWKRAWKDGHALWGALGSGGLGMRGSGGQSLQQLPMHRSWSYFGFWCSCNTKSMETLSHSPNSEAGRGLNRDTGGALLQLLVAQHQSPRSFGMALGAGVRDTVTHAPRNHTRGLKMLKIWVKAHRNDSLAI